MVFQMKFDLTDKIIIAVIVIPFAVALLWVASLNETLAIGGITGAIAGLVWGAFRFRKKQR